MIEDLSYINEKTIEETNQSYLTLKRRLLNSSVYMTSTELLVTSTPNLNNNLFYSACFQQNLKVMPAPTFAQRPLWPRNLHNELTLKESMNDLGVDG